MLFTLPGESEKNCKVQPVSVIFDTDTGNDIDDVLALQMLLNYEKAGKIKLIGITISKSNPYVIKFIDGYCRYNKHNDIPIGYAYNGATPEDGQYLLPTLNATVEGKNILQPLRSIENDIPEGYKLIRKLLTEQPPGSVIIIAVGPLTNISRLLNSKADRINTLNGIELVRQKVKFLSVMAGLYSNSFDFPEWNVKSDLDASQNTFLKCPVRIIASGWEVGNQLLYPHESILKDFGDPNKHPLSIAYQNYMNMPYDRQTWDLTAVLDAIEPNNGWFMHSKKGTIIIEKDGKSHFVPSKTGLHQYLIVPEKKAPIILQTLIKRVTNNNIKR